ncbi:MAG TPA: ribonuclease H-like domain-containing protein [Candidatus Kapabacteria bacterium]|nr:ribonuclease H-like domain-containing protein [Candidatus Kapabacteria bacterium]
MTQTFVFDIETVPLPFDESYDEVQKEYLLRGLSTEAEIENQKRLGALNPLLGRVVCIGLYIPELARGAALSLATEDSEETVEYEDHSIKYLTFADEAALLTHFWQGLDEVRYSAFVSFNGRNFDCPFLMLRSAALGVRPSINMMAGTRWSFRIAGKKYESDHIDLLDKLVFGAGFDKSGATRKFNLDFYTKSFGIKSPKAEGVTGYNVADFFVDGKIREIAEYCIRDVRATAELYDRWNTLLRF